MPQEPYEGEPRETGHHRRYWSRDERRIGVEVSADGQGDAGADRGWGDRPVAPAARQGAQLDRADRGRKADDHREPRHPQPDRAQQQREADGCGDYSQGHVVVLFMVAGTPPNPGCPPRIGVRGRLFAGMTVGCDLWAPAPYRSTGAGSSRA